MSRVRELNLLLASKKDLPEEHREFVQALNGQTRIVMRSIRMYDSVIHDCGGFFQRNPIMGNYALNGAVLRMVTSVYKLFRDPTGRSFPLKEAVRLLSLTGRPASSIKILLTDKIYEPMLDECEIIRNKVGAHLDTDCLHESPEISDTRMLFYFTRRYLSLVLEGLLPGMPEEINSFIQEDAFEEQLATFCKKLRE